MNHANEFDSILNEALREYREAEPLAGIEDRVLRRLQSYARPQPVVGWRRRMTAAVAVGVLVTLAWIGARHSHLRRPSSAQLVQQKTPAVSVSPEIPQIPNAEFHSAPGRPARPQAANVNTQPPTPPAVSRPAPVPGQFPMPRPPDSEERALFALAQSHPDALRPFLHEENYDPDIAPITIQPLEHNNIEGED